MALEGFDLEFVATHGAPSAELLAFYRAKVAAHEGDRRDLLSRLADAEAAGAELQRLRWEAREREEEVRELQRALSDARLALLDEREQALRLAAENDGLKAQEVEDRRRIAHLLALTEPLTHEFTFFRDSRPVPAPAAPATAARGPAAAGPAGRVGRNGFGVREPEAGGASAPAPAAAAAPAAPPAAFSTAPTSVRLSEGGRALRTIVLPSAHGPASGGGGPALDRSDALVLQCESLRRQLGDVQRLADERAGAYARDRDALRDQHERRAGADAAALRQLEAQLAAGQAKLTGLTRDYLQQRAAFGASERSLREHAAQCRAAREHAERELALRSADADAELGAMRAQLEASARQTRAALAAKAEAHNDAVRQLHAQWAADKAALSQQVASLQSALRDARAKTAALDRRRAGEAEGHARDVAALRRALRQLEAQWAVLGGAVQDAALSGQMREMEAHASDIAARLGALDAADADANADADAGAGLEAAAFGGGGAWLPSRAASVPSVITGIRPGPGAGAGARAARATQGRNTLAGSSQAAFLAREAAEAGAGASAGAPAARRPTARSQPVLHANTAAGKRPPVGSAYASPPSARRPAPAARGGPGHAVPMDVDPRSPQQQHPPSALRRAAGVAALAEQHLQRSQAQQTEEEEGEGEGEEAAGVSPARRLASTLGGPRRVPASAPDAAPRYDTTAGGGAGFGGEGEGEGEGGEGDEEASGLGSPGGIAARAATVKTLRLKASLVNVGQRISAIAGRFEH